MEWTLINPLNLPEKEVLAGNFKPGTCGYHEKLLGYLNREGSLISCEDEHTVLENCTHYIDINSFDPA